jgi:hypothetical protein
MKSYKHKDKRIHIPSKEEAGYVNIPNYQYQTANYTKKGH